VSEFDIDDDLKKRIINIQQTVRNLLQIHKVLGDSKNKDLINYIPALEKKGLEKLLKYNDYKKAHRQAYKLVQFLAGENFCLSPNLIGLVNVTYFEKALKNKINDEVWKIAANELRTIFNMPESSDESNISQNSNPAPRSAKMENSTIGSEPIFPAFPLLASLEAQLHDQGGNQGTFEQPDVTIKLSFDIEKNVEHIDPDEIYPKIQLSGCKIQMTFSGGAVNGDFIPGAKKEFDLYYLDPQQEIKRHSLEFRPKQSEPVRVHWISIVGKKGYRLFGASQWETLCTFEKRPQRLTLSLGAQPHQMRINWEDNESDASTNRQKNLERRVLDTCIKVNNCGRFDDQGYYILDEKDLIK
jgi:hypothetical protein